MAGEDLSGILVATVTPFTNGGERLELEFIAEHLELLAREGAQGVVPVGSNGEFPSLTLAEKKEVLSVAAGARGPLSLVAGVGSCALPEVLELLDHAAEIGADAALVPPPFYFSDVSAAGVTAFYRRVLAASELPILLYHIPQYTAVPITAEVIEPLLEYPNLVGIKDSSGSLENTAGYLQRWPHLRIFGGSDSQAGSLLEMGCTGVISGAANAFPGLLADIWTAHRRGRDTTIAADRVKALRQVLTCYPWIAATKYGLKLRGLRESGVRPPLMDMTDGQKREMEVRLGELGLI